MRKVLIMLLLPFFSLITLYGQTEKLCGIILEGNRPSYRCPRAAPELYICSGRRFLYNKIRPFSDRIDRACPVDGIPLSEFCIEAVNVTCNHTFASRTDTSA